MRAIDWAKTPVGPVETWPQSLRTVLSVVLNSAHPLFLWWGKELVQFYNDGYRPMLGSAKHPAAMGQRGIECFKEAWSVLEPLIERVRAGGATNEVDGLVPLDRNGFLEECYFSYGFSPVRDETGAVAGVFVVTAEQTGRVLGARRLAMLRELSVRTALDRSVDAVFRSQEDVLGHASADLPFVLLYELSGPGTARLVMATGLERGSPAAPEEMQLAGDAAWPIGSVVRTGQEGLVENLTARFGALAGKAWPEPVTRALMLPLSLGADGETSAVLVAGVSPRLPLNEDYRNFLQLLTRQMGARISSTRAVEREKLHLIELAELDRAKTAFFSNVSHEFRTPLTLILGPLEDAIAGEAPSLSGETLDLVRRNALRLQKLVNTLLDFSRIEAGRAEARFQPTDLCALTSDLSSSFRSLVEKAGLTFTVDCTPLDEPAYVDREMYEKIVFNLLSNAFKFTFRGGIRVTLRAKEGRVLLTVADTGVGIPAGELRHVFERFHRVEGVQGRSYEGSGIGLALVQELAKLHGGVVLVEAGSGMAPTSSSPLRSARSTFPLIASWPPPRPSRPVREPTRSSTRHRTGLPGGRKPSSPGRRGTSCWRTTTPTCASTCASSSPSRDGAWRRSATARRPSNARNSVFRTSC